MLPKHKKETLYLETTAQPRCPSQKPVTTKNPLLSSVTRQSISVQFTT